MPIDRETWESALVWAGHHLSLTDLANFLESAAYGIRNDEGFAFESGDKRGIHVHEHGIVKFLHGNIVEQWGPLRPKADRGGKPA